MSENIVFVNLVDASAVNTIIECIVRNTPIIVNKIPAVVEMLGENYPMYYTDHDLNVKIIKYLKNDKYIKKAYYYLKNMNKKKFTIDSFLSEFTNILKKIHIDMH